MHAVYVYQEAIGFVERSAQYAAERRQRALRQDEAAAAAARQHTAQRKHDMPTAGFLARSEGASSLTVRGDESLIHWLNVRRIY